MPSNGRAFSGEPSKRSERPERKRGRRVRCNAMFGPALISGLAREELRVIPDILVILRQKKPPTGRKTEIRKDGRQQRWNMRDMMRLEEI